jgi:hypothetical protein
MSSWVKCVQPAIISSSLTSLEEEKLLRVFGTQEKDKKKNKVETTSKYPPGFGCMVSKARNVKHTLNVRQSIII